MSATSAPKSYVRKKKIVDPGYQLRYSFTLITIATTEGIILAGVLLAAIFAVIEISPEDHVRLFYYIVTISAGMIVFLNLVNIAIGIMLSHRISGPVYRFVQVAKGLARGDLSQVIKLRDKDELQDLKDRLNEAFDGMRGLVREQNTQLDRTAAALRQMQVRAAGPGQTGAGEWNALVEDVEKMKTKFLI